MRIGQFMDILWIVALFWALAAAIFWKQHASVIGFFKGPVELTSESDWEEMTGEYISWEVKCPLGEYMETTKTTTINGASTGTKKSRSSWIVLDEEQGILLSVEVPVKRYDEIDAQCDRFYEAFEQTAEDSDIEIPEGILVAGTMEVLRGEELKYFRQAALTAGLPVEGNIYHIRDGIIYGAHDGNIWGTLLVGGILLLIPLLLLIKTMMNSAKKLIKKYLQEHPNITMEQLESDFAASEKVNQVWIGQNWTFSPKMKELLFDNQQLVWVHCGSVRMGKGVNFYVWWNLVDGSERKVSLSSLKKCTKVVEAYRRFPHVLVGSNPEYAYLLANDREALLDIAYRKLHSDFR